MAYSKHINIHEISHFIFCERARLFLQPSSANVATRSRSKVGCCHIADIRSYLLAHQYNILNFIVQYKLFPDYEKDARVMYERRRRERNFYCCA